MVPQKHWLDNDSYRNKKKKQMMLEYQVSLEFKPEVVKGGPIEQ